MTGPEAPLPQVPLIAVCANLAWNLVNFRAGLIAALRVRGCRVLAIAPPDAAMEARLRAMGCEFAAVAMDAKGLSPLRDIKTWLAIRRVLRARRPDAWLSWTIKPNVYGTLAAAGLGIPALPNVSGLGTAFIRRNLLTVLVKALYRAAFRRAATVFFQNDDDRDLFLAEGLVAPDQVRRLPGSGIDPEHWRPPSSDRPARRRFLMIARVVADKGVREYVAAAQTIKARWPDARFALLGFVDVANRTAIPAAEIARWQTDGLIELIPPADDVRPALNGADFVVLPSYREGLSRVLLEAAASGRAIVTTDVPGCRDIVRDGDNGYLCAPRDAGALAQALERAAATDDAVWQRMALAGRARVIAEFSQDRVDGIYLAALTAAGVALPDPMPNPA